MKDPLKQGLKLDEAIKYYKEKYGVEVKDPLKQGLKQISHNILLLRRFFG